MQTGSFANPNVLLVLAVLCRTLLKSNCQFMKINIVSIVISPLLEAKNAAVVPRCNEHQCCVAAQRTLVLSSHPMDLIAAGNRWWSKIFT
jgi:hypothetical protein